MMVDASIKLELTLKPGAVFLGSSGAEKWVSLPGGYCLVQNTGGNKPQLQADGLYFDGGDWLSGVATSLLASTFAVEFWVNFSTIPASLSAAVFLSKTLNVSNRFYLGFYNASGTHQLQIYSNSGGATAVNYVANTAFVTNTFYHLAFVGVGTTYRIFVNGSLIGSTTGAGSVADNGSNIVLGQELGTTFFNGKMTDVRIYNAAKYTTNFTPPQRSQCATPMPPPLPLAAIAAALVNQFDSGD